MRKKFLILVTIVVALAVGFVGCDSGTQPQKPQKKSPQAEGTADKAQAKKQETSPETQGSKKSTEASQGKEEGEEGTKQEEKAVKLDPDLPEPMFVGTPTNFESDNLDPKTGEPRGDFMVPENTKLVSVGKPVTSSDPDPVIGEISQVTDGTKTGYEGDYTALDPGVQWVQIDLENQYRIYAILLWHYHSQARVYRDVIVQVSNDPNFAEGVKTVFNNDHDNSAGLGVGEDYEYVETYEGKLIDCKGVTGRYVRVYSNGNTANEMNHFTEVAVYGKPAE